MKKVLYVLLLISSFNCVKAQVVTFIAENFNNGFPATWTRINNDGNTPQPVVSFVNNAWVAYEDTDSTGIGDSCAVATSYYTPAGTADDWMISPAITLKHRGNFLKWDAKSQDASYPDAYDVLISNTLPVIDSFYVDTALFSTSAQSATWTSYSVSLDTFANQTVYIAFRAKSTDKFLLLIDNINVYADTLVSVPEQALAENKVQVYPNPSNDRVFVNAEQTVNKALLFDMTGKQVVQFQPMTQRFEFSVNELNPGIYILHVIFADGKHSRIKIVRS